MDEFKKTNLNQISENNRKQFTLKLYLSFKYLKHHYALKLYFHQISSLPPSEKSSTRFSVESIKKKFIKFNSML